MKQTRLPRWANELLASCPQHGDGVHPWLFKTALKLHQLHLDNEQMKHLLDEATSGCGRPVPASEIENAVRNSSPDRNVQPYAGPRWPARNIGLIESIVRGGPNLPKLCDLSPVKWDDDDRHTEEIIDALYAGNPLLCAAPKNNFAFTRPREEWRGFLDKQQFIVPSPMTATRGTTKSGERSMRCLDNTGPRRFIVVEFDTGNFDRHAAILLQLVTLAPLVMCVHSGNKSLHGWFFVAGKPESTIERFFGYAVSLGADPATWPKP